MTGPILDALIVGVPKAGTTWLATQLMEHPEIDLPEKKELNLIATRQGTFKRGNQEPDLDSYERFFNGNGLKIDASIHSFACSEAPRRFFELNNDLRIVLVLREPVERTFSHWKMIIDTKEDSRNKCDWSDFKIAWDDDRLQADSLYATSMACWLETFPLKNFMIIDNKQMRDNPSEVLDEVGDFLGISAFDYDLNPDLKANRAADRRRINPLGRVMKTSFSLIPKFIRRPIAKRLQKRGVDIYSGKLVSSKTPDIELSDEHYSVCGEQLVEELIRFQAMTNFDTNHWINAIQDRMT